MSLDDLYEDGGRLDVDLLRSALLPYMRLVRNARTEDEAIRPTAAFEDLSARGKTLVVLLAQRARAALDDIAPDDVPVGPAAIAGLDWDGGRNTSPFAPATGGRTAGRAAGSGSVLLTFTRGRESRS